MITVIMVIRFVDGVLPQASDKANVIARSKVRDEAVTIKEPDGVTYFAAPATLLEFHVHEYSIPGVKLTVTDVEVTSRLYDWMATFMVESTGLLLAGPLISRAGVA